MPVHWTISHPRRLVLAVAKGPVTTTDIEQRFAGVTPAGGRTYAKIFEIAIVAASDESHAQACIFAEAGPVRRPLRELHAARRWLDEQPAPGGPGPS